MTAPGGLRSARESLEHTSRERSSFFIANSPGDCREEEEDLLPYCPVALLPWLA